MYNYIVDLLRVFETKAVTYKARRLYLEGKEKIERWQTTVGKAVNGHFDSCMIYRDDCDVVDTCNCHYYIHVQPGEIFKEIIDSYVQTCSDRP